LRPIGGGRDAIGGPEGAREGGDAAVSRAFRDRPDGTRLLHQFAGSAVQAQPAQRVGRGLAGHVRVYPVEMARRKGGDTGQRLEVDRLVEMVLDMGDDLLHAAAVVEHGAVFVHGSPRQLGR
jgi:hypothetical protein